MLSVFIAWVLNLFSQTFAATLYYLNILTKEGDKIISPGHTADIMR